MNFYSGHSEACSCCLASWGLNCIGPMLLPWSRRAKCWFFGVSVVRIWPKKVGLDEPVTLILAKTSKRCQSSQIKTCFWSTFQWCFHRSSSSWEMRWLYFFIYNRFGLSRSQEGYCSRYFFTTGSNWEKKLLPDNGAPSVRCRWHYWSRVIVCCVFHYTKIFFYQSKETFFRSRISAAF